MVERIEKLESKFEDMVSSLNEVLNSVKLIIASQNINAKQISRIFDGIKEDHEEPSILDKHKDRIEQILSHMTVYGYKDVSYTFITNADYSLRFNVESDEDEYGEYGETLALGLFAEDDFDRDQAVCKDFEITEGPISSAKMGDLFVGDYMEEITSSKLSIVAMKGKGLIFVNQLREQSIVSTCHNNNTKGLIFSPVHKG